MNNFQNNLKLNRSRYGVKLPFDSDNKTRPDNNWFVKWEQKIYWKDKQRMAPYWKQRMAPYWKIITQF